MTDFNKLISAQYRGQRGSRDNALERMRGIHRDESGQYTTADRSTAKRPDGVRQSINGQPASKARDNGGGVRRPALPAQPDTSADPWRAAAEIGLREFKARRDMARGMY